MTVDTAAPGSSLGIVPQLIMFSSMFTNIQSKLICIGWNLVFYSEFDVISSHTEMNVGNSMILKMQLISNHLIYVIFSGKAFDNR